MVRHMDQLAPNAEGYGGSAAVMWQGTPQFASDFAYALDLVERLIKIWFAEDSNAAEVLRSTEEEFVFTMDEYQQQFRNEWPMLEFNCICGHGNGEHLEDFFAISD